MPDLSSPATTGTWAPMGQTRTAVRPNIGHNNGNTSDEPAPRAPGPDRNDLDSRTGASPATRERFRLWISHTAGPQDQSPPRPSCPARGWVSAADVAAVQGGGQERRAPDSTGSCKLPLLKMSTLHAKSSIATAAIKRLALALVAVTHLGPGGYRSSFGVSSPRSGPHASNAGG